MTLDKMCHDAYSKRYHFILKGDTCGNECINTLHKFQHEAKYKRHDLHNTS